MPPTTGRRSARRLHRAAWPDMFANLQTAYAELTEFRFQLERRAAEVEEGHEFLQLVIASMSEALFRMDAAGRVVEANPAAGALLGRPASEVVGRPLAEVCGSDAVPATPRQLLDRGSTGVLADLEAEFRRTDGTAVPVSASCVLVRDTRGKIVGTLVVARDVTERKRSETAILRLNEDLRRRADELAAANRELEAFSYSVSHDLRAPLRAMDGFARILVEDFAPQLPAEARRRLDLVRQNAQQMGALIDDLLAFSRLGRQPISRQSVEPSELARQAVASLRPDMEGRRVEIEIADLPPARADAGMLRQVYANLIGNAVKFTRDRDPATIDVGSRRDGSETVYYVKDNGVGFDAKYAEKAFGVFQRLHRAEEYQGTGVGLAIVQRVVHRHGGRVWAEAAPGQGATFYFTLGEQAGDG
jgi:PAS domain S-box-containing protein